MEVGSIPTYMNFRLHTSFRTVRDCLYVTSSHLNLLYLHTEDLYNTQRSYFEESIPFPRRTALATYSYGDKVELPKYQKLQIQLQPNKSISLTYIILTSQKNQTTLEHNGTLHAKKVSGHYNNDIIMSRTKN